MGQQFVGHHNRMPRPHLGAGDVLGHVTAGGVGVAEHESVDPAYGVLRGQLPLDPGLGGDFHTTDGFGPLGEDRPAGFAGDGPTSRVNRTGAARPEERVGTPLVAGERPGHEEYYEQQRNPDFLVETEEAFGGGFMVAPSVIGDDHES
ncbi:MAG: hypothetical protein GEU98_07380 [Pseudonocardiaceae bacterium]|nr:hypothetical protein [Pseudonocardiaceae bacterium]